MASEPPAPRRGNVLLGFLLSIPLHVVGIMACMQAFVLFGIAPNVAPWPQRMQDIFMLAFCGLQWLYVIPVGYKMRDQRGTVTGLYIVSGLISFIGVVGLIHWH